MDYKWNSCSWNMHSTLYQALHRDKKLSRFLFFRNAGKSQSFARAWMLSWNTTTVTRLRKSRTILACSTKHVTAAYPVGLTSNPSICRGCLESPTVFSSSFLRRCKSVILQRWSTMHHQPVKLSPTQPKAVRSIASSTTMFRIEFHDINMSWHSMTIN